MVGLELRNGHHCVESTECDALESFVGAVLQAATGKTVYGGYYRHPRRMAGSTAYQIRSVTVCMHYVYAARTAESPNELLLSKIASAAHDQWHQLHVRVVERGGEVPPVCGRRQRRRDDDRVACAPLGGGKRGHDRFEASDRGRREQVQNGERGGQCDAGAEVTTLLSNVGAACRGATSPRAPGEGRHGSCSMPTQGMMSSCAGQHVLRCRLSIDESEPS